MALGFYRDSSVEGWFYLKDSSLMEGADHTDGWKGPYSCFDNDFCYGDSGYLNPKLLIPSKLLIFNKDEMETEE